MNVIKNAVEEVSPDDGYVGVAAEPDESDGRVTLIVTDSGPGFPKGEDPRRYLLPGVSTSNQPWQSRSMIRRVTVRPQPVFSDPALPFFVGNAEGLGAVVTFELPLRRRDRVA